MSGRRREKMANISTVKVQYRFREERNISLPVHWRKERSYNQLKGRSKRLTYFANTVDCSQKIKQFFIVRVEQLLIGEPTICEPCCQVSNCESMSWISGNIREMPSMCEHHIRLCVRSNPQSSTWQGP